MANEPELFVRVGRIPGWEIWKAHMEAVVYAGKAHPRDGPGKRLIEGCIEGCTGWAIGKGPEGVGEDTTEMDGEDLYNKLERTIIPTYYDRRDRWIEMMANAIGKNAYYFNSHRMMRRYVTEAYIR